MSVIQFVGNVSRKSVSIRRNDIRIMKLFLLSFSNFSGAAILNIVVTCCGSLIVLTQIAMIV